MMKYLAAVVISLLIGFALGGWGPRADVRRLKRELVEAGRGRRPNPADASLAGITRMLNVPDAEPTRAQTPRRAPPETNAVDTASSTEPGEALPEAPGTEPAVTPPAPVPEPTWRETTPEERLEEAIELWTIRSELARNSFLTNTGVDEDQALRFDVLVEAMNLRLETSIAEWADLLVTEQVAPPEAAVRMMYDITGAIALTYDEMDRSMPATWREDAGEKFQLFDFIDPRVATPLIGMEDRFDFE